MPSHSPLSSMAVDDLTRFWGILMAAARLHMGSMSGAIDGAGDPDTQGRDPDLLLVHALSAVDVDAIQGDGTAVKAVLLKVDVEDADGNTKTLQLLHTAEAARMSALAMALAADSGTTRSEP